MDAPRSSPHDAHAMGVLRHIKRLDDALGHFLVQITCKCGAQRIAEPDALARLCGSSATLEAVGKTYALLEEREEGRRSRRYFRPADSRATLSEVISGGARAASFQPRRPPATTAVRGGDHGQAGS